MALAKTCEIRIVKITAEVKRVQGKKEKVVILLCEGKCRAKGEQEKGLIILG
jgi:hypothetical protein